MSKPKQSHSLKNLRSLNTNIETKSKAAAADPAWQHAGEKEGIEIWRVENFSVKAWPKEKYGHFFSGDSYIVLKTITKGSYDLHFWLGESTSQDEAGTAAYKTVELDDHLGGAPVQHREVQGNESDRFLSYFPNGLRITNGGVDTGFNHVTPEAYKPRLLHIKGNMKSATATEVELSPKSLNTEDVFILDNGLELFQWNGKKADPGERMKASKILADIHSERNGKPEKPVILDEGEDNEKFWKLLGGKATSISATSTNVRRSAKPDKILFKLSDASGKLVFTEIAKGTAVKRNMLKSEDVFILDNGNEIFAWVGNKASPQERRNALIYAEDYLNDFKRPPSTSISKISEGHENEDFNGSF